MDYENAASVLIQIAGNLDLIVAQATNAETFEIRAKREVEHAGRVALLLVNFWPAKMKKHRSFLLSQKGATENEASFWRWEVVLHLIEQDDISVKPDSPYWHMIGLAKNSKGEDFFRGDPTDFLPDMSEGVSELDLKRIQAGNDADACRALAARLRSTASNRSLEAQSRDCKGWEPSPGSHDFEILEVLWIEQAFSASKLLTTDEIAVKASSDDDGNNYKSAVAELSRRQLVITRKGRNGGCWLSDTGKQLISRLLQ